MLVSLRWRQHDRKNKDRRKMEGENEAKKASEYKSMRENERE